MEAPKRLALVQGSWVAFCSSHWRCVCTGTTGLNTGRITLLRRKPVTCTLHHPNYVSKAEGPSTALKTHSNTRHLTENLLLVEEWCQRHCNSKSTKDNSGLRQKKPTPLNHHVTFVHACPQSWLLINTVPAQGLKLSLQWCLCITLAHNNFLGVHIAGNTAGARIPRYQIPPWASAQYSEKAVNIWKQWYCTSARPSELQDGERTTYRITYVDN